MLFSEIYGSYFNVVAAVLSEASAGCLTDRRMTELIQAKAFAYKRHNILAICVRELGLLSSKIGLGFITSGLVSPLQQTVDRTGIHAKAFRQFFHADTFVIRFQNQFSCFVM